MKKKDIGEKPYLKKKKTRSPGSWIDRVLPGCCTGWSFKKHRSVQPPDRPARPGLITVVGSQKKIIRISV
jgi:hypothetical protein